MDYHSDPSFASGYIDANGVHTYYEVVGAGDPLLLLHGGFSPIETFAGLTPLLAAEHRVYLPERRGHGRTPDAAGPFSYDITAGDTIAFIEAAGIGPSNVVGWSDGAVVGLLVAMKRPDLVRRLVMIGQYSNLEGIPQEMTGMLQLEHMPDMLPPMMKSMYEAHSPDGPEHWPTIVDKMWQMIRTEPTVPLQDLASVTMPVLLIVAEHDMVTPDYARAMQQAFGNARLEIVPDTSHDLPVTRPDIVAPLVLDFLGGTDA